MKIALRPHHLLCLAGYKGLNYSKSNVKNWNKISNYLNENLQTDILIVNKNDDLCAKCPAISNENFLCNAKAVSVIDNKVAKMLGIIQGKIYNFGDIKGKLYNIMNPQKHEQLCHDCTWWKKGLCKDSFISKK